MGYDIAVKNARMNVVKDAIDAGAAAGKLNLYSAGHALLLISIDLDDPCGSVTTGQLIFSGLPKDGLGLPAAGGGTDAVISDLVDSDDNLIYESLTTGVKDQPILGDRYQIEIDDKNIAEAEITKLLNLVITHG